MSNDPLERFTDCADDYKQFRPSYPKSVLGEISKSFDGASTSLRVADIGAGTGISSRLLASFGWDVTAVEPNAGMRAAFENVGPHQIDLKAGTAEATGLPGESHDLVTVFQAFHWFDPEPTLREFHRILREKGVVALVWNVRNPRDPFTLAYSEIIEQRSLPKDQELISRKNDSGLALLSSPLFTSGRKVVVENSQTLDLPSLLGRVRSVSYTPKAGPSYERMVEELSELVEKYSLNNEVTLQYDVEVYTAVKCQS